MIELRRIYLEAQSPRSAFYQLILFEQDDGTYLVSKKSGSAGKILNVRSWLKATRKDAEKKFNQMLHQKTSPHLKRRRCYRIMEQFPR